MISKMKWKAIAMCYGLVLLGSSGKAQQLTRYVNPFIGSQGVGHTFPGATVPFGMVQLSPDTQVDQWSSCSGYQFKDSSLFGFSHTHMSGTGAADLGDILFLPLSGPLDVAFLTKQKKLAMLKQTETARVGYYGVQLENGVKAELTATRYSGIHRYSYPASQGRSLLIDLKHTLKEEKIHQQELKQISDREIIGMRITSGFADNQPVYFVARFSAPVKNIKALMGGQLTDVKSLTTQDLKAIVEFEAGKEPIEIIVGISATGYDGAYKNIDSETRSFGFDKYVKQASQDWEKALGKVIVKKGATTNELTIFYSALYRTMICPNVFSDVDHKYYGMDGKIHQGSSAHYTIFSLWDTFRAVHPLFTVIDPERNAAMMQSLIDKADQNGSLPMWELWGADTDCMIGNHGISVLGEAIVKGLKGFDYEAAYQACKRTLAAGRVQLPLYAQYGYVPSNQVGRKSVSKSVEYAYNDWCMAQIAQKLGHMEDYRFYLERSKNYRKLFDGETGFFRGRRRDGVFEEGFSGNYMDDNFTEATPWQYRHFAPHDIVGLTNLLGGRDSLTKSLDRLFAADTAILGRHLPDVTGRLGQYAHGNEPSHGTVFLYAYSSEPWKTSAFSREVIERFYQNTPQGLSGNDDCGQMSAWYVFAALGMYPMCPGSDEFILTAPSFSETSINLPNGKMFTVKVKGDRNNVYIDKILLNGKLIDRNFIKYAEIMSGGTIEFTLSKTPNKKRAVSNKALPASMTTEQAAPTPYITGDYGNFIASFTAKLEVRHPRAKIYYTLDGSQPGKHSLLYNEPLSLRKTTTIKAIAYVDGMKESDLMTVEATRANFLPGLDVNPVKEGVAYDYYEGKMNSTADMLNMKKVRSGVVTQPGIKKLEHSEFFYGVIFKTYMKIEEKDVYTFYVYSDDGCVVYIDDQPVVLNDGSHSFIRGYGSIALDKGFHKVEVRYYQGTEHGDLMFGMKGGQIDGWGFPKGTFFVRE